MKLHLRNERLIEASYMTGSKLGYQIENNRPAGFGSPSGRVVSSGIAIVLTKGVRARHSCPPEWLAVSLQVKSGNLGRPNRQQQLIEEKDFKTLMFSRIAD
jgi:hypothetical protein